MEKFDVLLNHVFTPNDIGDEMTVREYLARQLVTLWEEGESFSGKRPFGNSGWEENLVIPAIVCGCMSGDIDNEDPEWPEATNWNGAAYQDMLERLIRHALGVA